ncbi:MAG TPA: class I SAM-dependent methyltransferase [Gaiellaceae bacterium]|nr:class I SAM-dependent methyltransferase [Gaiellaceae bacterium]
MSDAWALPAGSRDAWPDDYERGRPGWPASVLDVVPLPREAVVLELAAGTGKLTRLLVPAFDRVVAVEPEAGMRRRLVRLCPGAEALEGTAESIPLGDASADAVFAAEAFHRFDAEAAVAEIARVLRPGGPLVLLWNLPNGPTTPSIASVEALLRDRGPTREQAGYDPLDLNTTRYASGDWKRAFAGAPFTAFEEAQRDHVQVVDREGLVSFFASMGWIGDRPDPERLPLLDEVRSLLDAGAYRRPWRTHVHWARRDD